MAILTLKTAQTTTLKIVMAKTKTAKVSHQTMTHRETTLKLKAQLTALNKRTTTHKDKNAHLKVMTLATIETAIKIAIKLTLNKTMNLLLKKTNKIHQQRPANFQTTA